VTIREQAIRLCEIASCEATVSLSATWLEQAAVDVGVSEQAEQIADQAMCVVYFSTKLSMFVESDIRTAYAEAAGILRDRIGLK
jgi:hypothetical protein